MAEWLGVDSLGYLTIDGMMEAVTTANTSEKGYCHACFSRTYPVPVDMTVSKDENEW